MLLTIQKALDKCSTGRCGYYQRVFINESHDRCLFIEKISICNEVVYCVTCQVWTGSWYSYTPILIPRADAKSIVEKCGAFIGIKNLNKNRRRR